MENNHIKILLDTATTLSNYYIIGLFYRILLYNRYYNEIVKKKYVIKILTSTEVDKIINYVPS